MSINKGESGERVKPSRLRTGMKERRVGATPRPCKPAQLSFAALYIRVSTDEQKVDLQVDDLRRVAAQRGWEIVGEYIDEGVSGGKWNRPALDRLMKDAHRGLFSVVAVWRFDRFARSTQHLIYAMEAFRQMGIDFISLHEQIDTSTPAGRMLFTLIASMAEFERGIISERVKAGIAAAKARGICCGRPTREFDVGLAKKLRSEGVPWRKIAQKVHAPQATVRVVLKRDGFKDAAMCKKPPEIPGGETGPSL